MLVKDVNGHEFETATKGKTNAALTLGIIGTGLAALGGNLFNGSGLLGGNAAATVALPEQKYYEDTICNLKEFFNYAQGVSDRICNLEQRVAVDETAIAWQNRLIDKEFACVDTRFMTNDQLMKYYVDSKTCKCIQGQVYASPSDLADPYVGRRLVLGSYSEPFCGYNNGCGGGYGNFNGGCGC